MDRMEGINILEDEASRAHNRIAAPVKRGNGDGSIGGTVSKRDISSQVQHLNGPSVYGDRSVNTFLLFHDCVHNKLHGIQPRAASIFL